MKNHFVKITLLTFSTGLLTRLMFLNSNVFFFDGDEAVLGVMALDLLNGEPSLFFYGQTYGFSFIEVLMISVGIKIFGTSMLAIKIPMLLIWLSSVTLIGLTIQKITNNTTLTFLSILIIMLSPTWLVWSMKARGGYLTSFFCSSLIIYLLIHYKHRLKLVQISLVGILLTLIWESQPIWFLPTVVIVAYSLIVASPHKKANRIKSAIFMLVGSGITYAAFYYYKSSLDSIWHIPKPNLFNRIGKIGESADVLINNLGGNYFLSSAYTPNNELYAKIFLSGFAAAAITVVYNLFKNRKIGLDLVFLISSFGSLTGFFVKSEPRYLLPFFSFSLVTMVLAYFNKKDRTNRYKIVLFSIISLAGLIHLFNFKSYSFVNMSISKVDEVSDDRKIMEDLIQLLKREHIKYVYSTNEFLQYQINYMTNHEILAVSRIDRCRTPRNVLKVQSEYNGNENQFAVIGYNFRFAYSGKIPVIGNKIFYIIRPSRQLLDQVGFFKNLTGTVHNGG